MEKKTLLSLKENIGNERKVVKALHDEGADGLTVSSALCRIADDLILTLLDLEQESHSFSGAVVAIGGYGRGLLNPYSDIDILFLLDRKLGKKGGESPHETLAQLWDLGFKVGHAARTIDDTITVGLADLTARTAMIESRFLCGNSELFEQFCKKFSRDVIRYKPNVFIKAKIDEMERRRFAHGRYACLTEPNIKESPGGLRDFHTALWLLKSKMEFSSLDDLAKNSLVTKEEIDTVEKSHSFLLRLRNGLHWNTEKGEDTLSHNYQTDIARANGFSEGSDNIICAGLMAEYFVAAQTIELFANDMAALALDYRKRWSIKPIFKDPDGLFSDGRKLFAHSFPPETYDEKPEILFNIARRMSVEGLTASPNLYKGLAKIAEEAPKKWFEGEEAGKFLVRILKLQHSSGAITLFHDAGILTRLIPEFKSVTRLSQFDLFHRYSVDQHILAAVTKFEDIPHGATVNEWMRDIWRSQPDLYVVKLALLLHDLGKRAEDRHLIEEDERTGAILSRLGLSDLVAPIEFLVKEHVFMSSTAQKLDYSDPATLRDFCAVVQNRVNLKRLYLLTYADIAAVGPGIWNEWKDKLLFDLYNQADRYFMDGSAHILSFDDQLKALLEPAQKAARGSILPDKIKEFLNKAPTRYLSMAQPEYIVADMALMDRYAKNGLAIRYDTNLGDSTGRFTFAAKDTIGLISTVTGALVAKNVGVVEAHIHSFEGKLALDTFVVEGAGLSVFTDSGAFTRFEKELSEALAGDRDVNEMVLRHTRFMGPEKTLGAHPFEPHVAILNHLSEAYSIIEVWAPDRIGLLYDIARTMAKLKLDISSAKISTEGPKAINVFYVMTEAGTKIGDTAYESSVAKAISAAIKSPAGVD